MSDFRSATPTLVEILGVAGSGKSSLASRLLVGPRIERAPFISARNPRHLLTFAVSLPRLSPLLLANIFAKPRMTWADYKLMVYGTSGMRILNGQHHETGTVLVLDQGPLYAQVRLRARDLGIGSHSSFQNWCSETLRAWIPAISLVVHLDAADRVLVQRINERSQEHTTKGGTTAEAIRFIERYRSLFMGVVDEVRGQGGLVLQYDTALMSIEDIAVDVMKAIAAWREAPG